MASRIGVDIGGTFTDLIFYDDRSGSMVVEKVPTTPASPEQGCVSAIRRAVPIDALGATSYFLHGTTVGLNALLERRGSTVGLLTTAGFRDILEIGRGSRLEAYNLMWAPQAPLVSRRLRLPVRERTHADGHVATEVVAADIIEALEQFRRAEVTAIAVAFINGYANPKNERAAERILRDAGFEGAISLSSQVSGEYGEYERTSTTVIDAFVRARMSGYLSHIEGELNKSGFSGQCLLMRSGSGSMSFTEAQERPFETIMSGPVAGAEGAAELARSLALGDLITADVGGTSFDTCVIIDGKPQLQFQGEVGGMPLKASWVDVRSIGAGGGSVAYIDSGGGLKVGPRSSGAMPGPACYDRGGTEPCVTDAAFYLGMLGQGRLASGLQLNMSRAIDALKSVGHPLGYNSEQVARGILQIVTVSMANAIREITVEQGIDPRRMRLLAFGGAGPLLATLLARELSMSEIIVPPYAGNFSAWGLLGANIVRSASATRFVRLDERALGHVQEAASALFGDIDRRAAGNNSGQPEVKELTLDMRYQGQEHTLSVHVPIGSHGRIMIDKDALAVAFSEAYKRTYGSALEQPIEIVAVRAAIRQVLPRRKSHSQSTPISHGVSVSSSHEAASFSVGGRQRFNIVNRSDLLPGVTQHGPAIILEPTATTYVDCDFDFKVDDNHCLWLVRASKTDERPSF